MSLFRTLHVTLEERVLEYVDGAFTRELGPGRHRRRARRRAHYRRVRLPEQVETLAPQEVPTADGVGVRVSLALRWAVGDARRFVEVAEDPVAVVYLAAQVALREQLADVALEAVAREARVATAGTLTEAVRVAGATVGVEVREVVVKDVVLPADVRSSLAELATSRTRGQARLEAARAETAALRSLANGARLLEEHPALARQRLVEALPLGSTVELR